MTPPPGDIAHVGHAELLTPDLAAGVRFFTDPPSADSCWSTASPSGCHR
ncbi:hypothetical protein ACFCXL_04100 [[Kitasatospora] papulosa]